MVSQISSPGVAVLAFRGTHPAPLAMRTGSTLMQLPPIAKLVSPVQKKFASEWPPPCYLRHPLFCALALNFYFTARFDGRADSQTLLFLYLSLPERRRRGAAGFLSLMVLWRCGCDLSHW